MTEIPNESNAADSDSSVELPNTNAIAHTVNELPVGGVHRLRDADLPYRFKQSTFSLFEPHIAKAIKSPDGVIVNPAPFRATTWCARCRDAIVSKKRFNWPASFTTLELEAADLVVRHSDFNVIIGPRRLAKGRVGGESIAIANADSAKLSGVHVNKDLTFAQLQAICELLGGQIISGPFILNYRVSDSNVTDLESKYDVAFQFNEKGETVIV